MFKYLGIAAIIIFLFFYTASAATFSRDLYFGLRNDSEVVRLQNFLKNLGYFNYPQSTGNFFTVTLDAVKKFQIANKIQPVGGYFGPISRAKADEIINSGVGGQSLISPSATSTFYGKIRISSFSGSSETSEEEIIEIENADSPKLINITGWTFENSLGNRLEIPRAYSLPGLPNQSLDNLVLSPGERVVISMGSQNRQINFRENICAGYFEENFEFKPSLSQSCPRPDTTKLSHLNDNCLSVIDSTSSCRAPDASVFLTINSACSEYLSSNLNYAGCVKNYRSRPYFYLNRWLVWMQRKEEFFRNTHDKVILRDLQGKFVDEYSY